MESILCTDMLTKRYGKNIVVDEVCMHVDKGDIYGFIGKNGAGKTSVMKMVCGITKESEGTIELFGSKNLQKSRRRIGCVIEQPALYPGLSAYDNLLYYDKILGVTDYSNIQEVLRLVGLEGVGKKKTKRFSLGMKQRLSIAISLLGNPDFLVLDEPINGLDPSGIREIRELILKLNQENKITVLISSHILGELAKIATKYGVIESGKLVDEFSVNELESRCKKCLVMEVDDVKKATYVLDNQYCSKDYRVFEQNKICVYDKLNSPEDLTRYLVESHVGVRRIGLEGRDLEAYFVGLMGGNVHA